MRSSGPFPGRVGSLERGWKGKQNEPSRPRIHRAVTEIWRREHGWTRELVSTTCRACRRTSSAPFREREGSSGRGETCGLNAPRRSRNGRELAEMWCRDVGILTRRRQREELPVSNRLWCSRADVLGLDRTGRARAQQRKKNGVRTWLGSQDIAQSVSPTPANRAPGLQERFRGEFLTDRLVCATAGKGLTRRIERAQDRRKRTRGRGGWGAGVVDEAHQCKCRHWLRPE